MATDLTRGAYSGKETYSYYNSAATYASPTWVEMVRIRNVQTNWGPNLGEIEFHGASATTNIPGYVRFTGSFEYVRKLGTDTVWDQMLTTRNGGEILDFAYLNGEVTDSNAIGWRAPLLLGEFQETANGNDGVIVTIPFALADAYTTGGAAQSVVAFAGS